MKCIGIERLLKIRLIRKGPILMILKHYLKNNIKRDDWSNQITASCLTWLETNKKILFKIINWNKKKSRRKGEKDACIVIDELRFIISEVSFHHFLWKLL